MTYMLPWFEDQQRSVHFAAGELRTLCHPSWPQCGELGVELYPLCRVPTAQRRHAHDPAEELLPGE